MRWSIILLLIAFTGCQAPEDGADLRIAFIESDPLAGFVSDDPCGWDDPLSFNDLPEDPGNNHQRCVYFDDGAAENPVVRRVLLSIYADGTARVGYEPMAGGIETWDANWTRVDGECAIEVRSDDGELITYLGNPTPGDVDDPGVTEVVFLESVFDDAEDGSAYSCGNSEGSGF